MPDLLASTSPLSLTPAIAPRPPVAAPAVADFMALLGELVLPPGAKLQGGKGQALAGDGKDLPVEGEIGAGEGDDTDPVLAWFPGALVPPQPADPVALPGTVSAPAPVNEAGLVAVPVEAAPVGITDGEIATPEMPPEMPIATPESEPAAKADAPARERLSRPVLAPMSIPQPVVPGAPAAQTAGQVFAAAISAAFDLPAAPAVRAGDTAIVQAQTATEQLRTTVQAMSGAEQAPLDLSRDDWAGKMIDRIVTLRDAAEAADTRIRLAPENLGNVEVSIRRDGDRLHVHFAAENPATRQLLAETAPRLAELADARGVKLGQTSVDAGTGGQHGQPDQSQPNQSARPASAAAHTTQSDRDHRVA